MDASVIGGIVIGGVLMLLGGLAWSGRWTWWARSVHMDNLPITVVPGVGLLVFSVNVYSTLPRALGALLALSGFVAVIGGFVLYGAAPSWYGPKWYRQRDDTRLDLSVPGNASLAVSTPVPRRKNSRRAAEDARADKQLLASRSAALVGPEWGKPSAIHTEGVIWGRLLFYADELVFAAIEADDATRGGPTVRSLPTAEITEVRAVGNTAKRDLRRPIPFRHLLVGTGEHAWRVETQRPGRLIADLGRHYAARSPR